MKQGTLRIIITRQRGECKINTDSGTLSYFQTISTHVIFITSFSGRLAQRKYVIMHKDLTLMCLKPHYLLNRKLFKVVNTTFLKYVLQENTVSVFVLERFMFHSECNLLFLIMCFKWLHWQWLLSQYFNILIIVFISMTSQMYSFLIFLDHWKPIIFFS